MSAYDPKRTSTGSKLLQREVDKKRGAPETDAVFCWPKGKGKGIWLLLHANARAWVQQNRAAIPRRALGR